MTKWMQKGSDNEVKFNELLCCVSHISVAEIKAETVVHNQFPQTFSQLQSLLRSLKFDALGEALSKSKAAILQPDMREELHGL